MRTGNIAILELAPEQISALAARKGVQWTPIEESKAPDGRSADAFYDMVAAIDRALRPDLIKAQLALVQTRMDAAAHPASLATMGLTKAQAPEDCIVARTPGGPEILDFMYFGCFGGEPGTGDWPGDLVCGVALSELGGAAVWLDVPAVTGRQPSRAIFRLDATWCALADEAQRAIAAQVPEFTQATLTIKWIED